MQDGWCCLFIVQVTLRLYLPPLSCHSLPYLERWLGLVESDVNTFKEQLQAPRGSMRQLCDQLQKLQSLVCGVACHCPLGHAPSFLHCSRGNNPSSHPRHPENAPLHMDPSDVMQKETPLARAPTTSPTMVHPSPDVSGPFSSPSPAQAIGGALHSERGEETALPTTKKRRTMAPAYDQVLESVKRWDNLNTCLMVRCLHEVLVLILECYMLFIFQGSFSFHCILFKHNKGSWKIF